MSLVWSAFLRVAFRAVLVSGPLLTVGAGSLRAADEWPQFRGPQRDDIARETGLLAQWPADGPKLAWKASGVGEGYSGVSIAKGRIYTMGDKEGSSNVFALAEADGSGVWSARVGAVGGGGGYPGPRCTPTVDGDRLYVLNQFGDLVCLQTADGKEVWRKNLQRDFGGRMMSGWGYAESPLVDGPNVICTPGGAAGTLVALNKLTGELVWQSKEIQDPAAYSSLLPVEFGSVRQYIQLTGRSVFGVAAADGRLLWRGDFPGKTAVITTPVFKDGIVFVTSGYGVGCYAFQITATGSKFEAAQIYASKEMANHHGGVVLLDDYLYGFSDNNRMLKCMELKSGKVRWANKCVGKGSLTCADGHLVVRAEGGKGAVALVAATPEAYREQGRFNQPERSQKNSWPHPVVCGGRLYLRDQDVLLCYQVKP